MASVFTLTVSSSIGLQVVQSSYVSPIPLSVSVGLGLQPVETLAVTRTLSLSVSAGFSLQPAIAGLTDISVHVISVAAGLGLQPVAAAVGARVIPISVSAGLGLQAVATEIPSRVYALSVAASIGLQVVILSSSTTGIHQLSVSAGLGLQPAVILNKTKILSVGAGLGLQPSVSTAATRQLTVSAAINLQPVTTAPREISVSVTAGMGFQVTPSQPNALAAGSVSTHVALRPTVTASIGGISVAAGLGLQTEVFTELIVAQGVGLPGESPTGGPSYPLMRNISGAYPFTFAETPNGNVLMANGVDPMIRWDCLSNSADFAGVIPPVAGPTLAGSGLGTITGIRYAFARFIDSTGHPSNLSPIGPPLACGSDRLIDNIQTSASGQVTITTRGHGLKQGAAIIVQGVVGLGINGQFSISFVDPDHFTLNGIVAAGAWAGGGSWVVGVQTLTYTNLPVSTQAKVVRLQLLRNLEGNLDSLYVDVDTTVLNATSATSNLSDEQLAQGAAVPIRTTSGFPLANRYGVPPSNRPYLTAYMGRIFAAGDAIYYAGCVSVASGQNVIQGIGTLWSAGLVGRRIYIAGATKSYGVLAINVASQIMTLDAPYSDLTNPFATYTIRSSPADRKQIAWSEADSPEAWAQWSALGVPEDNDEIVGLVVKGTFLFVVERRHIWRFQFTDDPATTGHVFLAIERGAINQRCIVQADDTVFIMDESGIYGFDGGNGIDPVADPVQVLWQMDSLSLTYQIDWSQDTTLWHASLDPIKTTIRWFVAFVGLDPLTTAICFNYRTKIWWLETYPVAISSSCTGTIAEAPNVAIPSGYRRPVVGAAARMVLVLGEGSLDLVQDVGTLRGNVYASSSVSITDPLANFGPGLAGAPLTIVAGTGAGQTQIISSSTANTLTVVEGWTTIPDTSSVYQIGGVPWKWTSGWMDVEDDEADTNRDFVLSFQPLTSDTWVSVQFYYDHSLTPEIWGIPYSKDGVLVCIDRPDVWFNLTSTDVIPGYRVFRGARHTERYGYEDRWIQIVMSGVTNDEVVRIYQVSIRGVDQEGI